jgi:hypothetical protein
MRGLSPVQRGSRFFVAFSGSGGAASSATDEKKIQSAPHGREFMTEVIGKFVIAPESVTG